MFWSASSVVFTWTLRSKTNLSVPGPAQQIKDRRPHRGLRSQRKLAIPARTAKYRKSPKTVPLVIMGNPQHNQSLDDTGALFAFEKPISVEQAVRTLSAARSMILDGRLRYHRAGLEVPVSVSYKGHKPMDAFLVNLSQGGMQIHTKDPLEAAKALQVSFELPGARSSLKTKAEVAWQDKRGNMGVRFVKLAPQQQRTLQLWLAQQYFTN